MAATPNKQEPVFELIRSMSKAEKRNFKLYATRLAGNQEAKFLTLFDCLDSLDEYDEKRILQRCPIKKEQLPNMKAHLYKQILVSIRLLDVQRTVPMQLREQIDLHVSSSTRDCTGRVRNCSTKPPNWHSPMSSTRWPSTSSKCRKRSKR